MIDVIVGKTNLVRNLVFVLFYTFYSTNRLELLGSELVENQK